MKQNPHSETDSRKIVSLLSVRYAARQSNGF
jgi:hypothetical protein